jgi:hypothetical protein
MRKGLLNVSIILFVACVTLLGCCYIKRGSQNNITSSPLASQLPDDEVERAVPSQTLKHESLSVQDDQNDAEKREAVTIEQSSPSDVEQISVKQTSSKPAVMTDYQSWTLIANGIKTVDDDHSLASGEIGVAHRDGAFFVANEAVVSHTNSTGLIDSIYLPGETSADIGNGSLTAENATLNQNDDGNLSVRADVIKFSIKPNPENQKY